MPRNVNPGDIRVGKGLAPEGTVEDNSLRYPERDADPLRVHIHDPSRAHMASAIGIVDEADCYVSDEVEGALQELCGHTGAGRLNGLISGGTFDEFGGNANGTGPIALAGISSTLTLVSPTEVLMNGTVFDASALTVVLPAAADTYYIYLETEATHPSYRTLVAGTAPPPEVETGTGVENVMFAKVVHDGTDITSWQDARFFVRNLDRKVSYSSRQGENVDAWSEGCFATLEAFFFWAQNYGDTGTSEEEKGTVLIRGQHLISQSLVVPTDHLQFVGDGEAILLVGNAPLDIFTLSGKSDISFHGINFASQVAGSRGIVATGLCNDIVVDSCTFGKVAGVGFLGAVSIGGGAGHNRIRMSGCDALLAGDNCFALSADGGPGQGTATVENCLFRGPGVSVPGVAIALAPGSGGKGASVLNTTIDGFYHGIQTGQMQEVRISNTVIRDVQTGFQTNAQVDHLYVSGCSIYLDDNLGKYGIWIKDNSTTINISDTYLQQLLTDMTDTTGIWIEAPAGKQALVVIEGCQMEGFYDSVGNTGHGIRLQGSNTDPFRNATIANCTLIGSPIAVETGTGIAITGNTASAGGTVTTMDLLHIKGGDGVTITGNVLAALGNADKAVCLDGGAVGSSCASVIVANNEIRGAKTHSIHLEGVVLRTSITGNLIDGFIPGVAGGGAPTSVGILADGSDAGVPVESVIDANTIRRSMGGIWIRGFNTTLQSHTFTVSNNNLVEIAYDQAQRTESFDGYGTKALACEWAHDISFVGNKVTDMGVVRDNDGTPVVFPNSVWCLGIYLRNSWRLMVGGNTISQSQSTATGACLGIVGHLNGLPGVGQMGAVAITDNTVACGDANGSDAVGVGFYLTDPTHACILEGAVIRGNRVIATKGNEVVTGIRITSMDINSVAYGGSCDGLEITGNRVENFERRGIDLDLPAQGTMHYMNTAFGVVMADNYLWAGGSAVGCAGIAVNCEGGIQNGVLRDLVVRNNDIPGWFGYGIAIRTDGVGGGGYPLFMGCHIDGNTMGEGAPAPGGTHTAIGVSRLGTGYPVASSLSLGITNNKVGNANFAHAPPQAIAVDLGTDTEPAALRGFELIGNTTYSYHDSSLPGVLLTYAGGGDVPTSLLEYTIDNNRFISLETGSAGTALRLDITNASLRSFSLSNNFLSAGDSATENAKGCDMQLVATTNAAADDIQWRVQGNEMHGNLNIALTRHSLREVGITDNMIGMAPLEGTTAASGYANISLFVDGQDRPATNLNTLAISNNVTKGGNHGIRVHTANLTDGVEGVRITDNTTKGQTAPNAGNFHPDLGHGIWVEWCTALEPLNEADGIAIDGNQSIQDVGWNGYHILADLSNITTVHNVSVSRNQLTGPHYLSASNYFQQASLVVARAIGHDGTSNTYNLQIDGNEIGGDDSWDNAPQNGIYFYGPTNCTAFHKVENLSLSGNVVRVKAESGQAGNKGRGMWVQFNDERSSPYTVSGVKIDNNQIFGDNPGRANEASSYVDGMIVELTCSVRGLSVSNNTLTNDSTRMNRYGLRIYQDFNIGQCSRDEKAQNVDTPWAYIYIAGNANPIFAAKWDFDAWPTEASKFKAVTWEDVAVRDNTILWGAGRPEGIVHATEGKWSQFGTFVFSHIQVLFNPDAQGVPGSWVPAVPPMGYPHELYHWRPICIPVWGCSITGNTVRANRSNSTLLYNGVPTGNTSDAFFGVRINACSPYLRWPNQTAQGGIYPGGISAYLQEGWDVVGNSAVFYMIKTEGDPATFTGQCVKSIIGHTVSSDSQWPGHGLHGEPLAMNEATDNDTVHMGWGSLGNTSFVGMTPADADQPTNAVGAPLPTARNHNGVPRTQ